MKYEDKNYYINNPIFIKYKSKFDFSRFSKVKKVKKVFINERIVEIPFVIQSMPTDKSVEVLDLGCVESSIPIHLSSLGYKLVGVDFRICPYAHPNFRFVRSDILKLPFKDDYFDIVTCVSTLEHIGLGFYSDQAIENYADINALKAIYKVLKKGGLLILTLPCGIKRETAQQRIYDLESLKILLKDFNVKQEKYFANFSGGRNNYWLEIDKEKACKIESEDGSTNCVYLAQAQK